MARHKSRSRGPCRADLSDEALAKSEARTLPARGFHNIRIWRSVAFLKIQCPSRPQDMNLGAFALC
jgi:hypothetical protein